MAEETSLTVIHFVPHTHWDREWYEPFQVFRIRLVELVDGVLDQLEREPAFRFTLDGQLATIDDYLEVRPEAEGRIRRFVGEGRLAIGPWQILMDEFLISGETIVRNLQRGWARAQDFGGAMAVGYLPDMFGHVAQMPQILRAAGIGQAVVWRGVPASVTGNRFRWRSPDGSEVDAEYLVGGYGNAAHLLADPTQAPARVRGYRELMGSWYGDESLLAMYGTDHMSPPPEMVSVLETINNAQSAITVRIETLADYMASTNGGTPSGMVIEGELRSGARANMLMGVTSAHVDIKRAAAHAERWLTRYAEPLAALHAEVWPSRLLELAWQRVIECSAHDSICGCSVDPVAAQVLVRLAEAEQIARELSRRTVTGVAGLVPTGSWAWFNPSPHARSGLIELNVRTPAEPASVALELADGRLIGTQEISRNTPLLYQAEGTSADITTFLQRRLHRRELFGRRLNGVKIDPGTVTLWLDETPDPEQLDIAQLLRQIDDALAAEPDARWVLRVLTAPRRKVQAMVPAPALGFGSARPVPGPGVVEQPVNVGPDSLDNGLISVRIAPDGTLTLARDGVTLTGVGRLVDGGDAGDSYNFGPPTDDVVVDVPAEITTAVACDGPVVGELVVSRSYRWPVGLSDDRAARSSSGTDTKVDMHVEVRAGEPFVRIGIEFDNQADDHRLRFHVRLPEAAQGSAAEGQFAVVERGLTVEGGHGEVPLATHPAYAFVAAGGVAALLDHVTEYELIDGRELALTCLRSIGWISRNDNPYREDPAGPERAVPAAQMHGRQSIRFALLPYAGDWRAAELTRHADDYAHDFLATPGRAPSDVSAASVTGLAVAGEGVATTALLRRGDWLELRVVNESPKETSAAVSGGIIAARGADLLGRPGEGIAVEDGSVSLRLGPAEVRTIQLQR